MKLPNNIAKGVHVFSKKLATVIIAGSIAFSGTANAFSLDNVNIDFSNVANKAAQVLLGSDSNIDSKVKVKHKHGQVQTDWSLDSDKVSVRKSRWQDKPDVSFEVFGIPIEIDN
jgi:hypothetical protein